MHADHAGPVSHVETSGGAGRPAAGAWMIWGERMMKKKEKKQEVDPAENLKSDVLAQREKKRELSTQMQK